MTCQTSPDHTGVAVPPACISALLGTSYDRQYDDRRYVAVLETWMSHVIHRLSDVLFNWFIKKVAGEVNDVHPLEAVSQMLTEGNYFSHADWLQEVLAGMNLWSGVLAQFLSACT